MNLGLNFDDVLILPNRTTLSSRSEVSLERTYQFYHSPRIWHGVPIISVNMIQTGCVGMSEILKTFKIITWLHKFHDLGPLSEYIKGNMDYVWASMGKNEEDIKKVKQLGFQPNLRIDVPNGYCEDFVKFCSKVRNEFPDSIIAAGNVCTSEMTQELIIHGGIDIVVEGIGGGSNCLSRVKTGVGCPQLTTVLNTSKVAHGLKSGEKKMGLIVSDGGCTNPGDVCKAFVGGADFVGLGGMFMGCDENEGEWSYDEYPFNNDGHVKYGNKSSIKCYGLSSRTAQEKHFTVKNYRTTEGRTTQIPYKGTTTEVVEDILGGLRSCATYIGATSIKDFSKCGEFIQVNQTHNQIFKDYTIGN